MSKKDYTKFSNSKPNHKVEEPIEEIQNGVQEVETIEAEPVEEVVEEVVEEQLPDPFGIVVDCAKLNVRKAPSANADIVCVIDASTNLVVDSKASTDEFYKICTSAGIEGYCMKKFIKIL